MLIKINTLYKSLLDGWISLLITIYSIKIMKNFMKNLLPFVFLSLIFSLVCFAKPNNNTQPPNNICTICYSHSANILLLCNHRMCSSCLTNIKNTSNTCPYCRETINVSTPAAVNNPPPNNDAIQKFFSIIRNNRYNELKDYILKIPIDTTDQFGNTSLHIAAQNNCVKITKLLLQHGANVNATNSKGDSALHYAYTYQYNKIINLLLTKNASTLARNHNGRLPAQGVK
jgi:hypothetical protein